MREMRLTGFMHNHMRMYWGKKIIEWSATCQDALETMLHIHDRWALDGTQLMAKVQYAVRW